MVLRWSRQALSVSVRKLVKYYKVLFKAVKNERHNLLCILQNSKRSKIICEPLLTYKYNSFICIPLCSTEDRKQRNYSKDCNYINAKAKVNAASPQAHSSWVVGGKWPWMKTEKPQGRRHQQWVTWGRLHS